MPTENPLQRVNLRYYLIYLRVQSRSYQVEDLRGLHV
jgi:hypothetical protein